MPPFARFMPWLLRRLADDEIRISILEYLEGEYANDLERKGPFFGGLRYVFRAIQILFSLLAETFTWRLSMIRNYLKTFLRSGRRQKIYSFVNVAGLSMGMICCLVIALIVRDEISFDRFHPRFDRIYRVLTETQGAGRPSLGAPTALPLAPALKADLAEIEKTARISDQTSCLVEAGAKSFYEDLLFVDPEFLEIFSFPLLAGDVRSALAQPSSIMITGRMAKKYFGRENPLGQILTIQNRGDFRVTGVLRDIPRNSHLRFDFLAPISTLNDLPRWTAWSQFSNDYTYALLSEGTEAEALEAKFPAFLKKYLPEDLRGDYGLKLQPLEEIHFSSIRHDIAVTSDKKYIYIYPAIGLFILLIACVNFMNLSTARSSRRAREIGLRKVVGARRSQLIQQFFAESIGLAVVSLLLAGGLVKLVLPRINQFLRKDMAFDPFADGGLAAGLLALTLVVGLISGSYPALVLSSFQPAAVLKKQSIVRGRRHSFLTMSVICQFAVSILLIICTMTVFRQLNFMKNRDLGFPADQIVALPLSGSPIVNNTETFRREILQNPAVVSASISSGTPASGYGITMDFLPEGRDESSKISMAVIFADFDFLATYGLTLVAGRDFSLAFATDKTQAVLINETAAKKLPWDSPLGKRFTDGEAGESREIIGVVKDFHYDSMRSRIEPTAIAISSSLPRFLSAKIRPENVAQTLAFLETTWKNHAPRNPFSYFFINEEFDNWYRSERRLGTIFSVFAGLAVFISCLGIFGLAAFSVEQRTKEIGVRKILGASTPGILRLLSGEFLGWIAIANLIAWPVAYLAMKKWLMGFPYRTPMGYGMFVLAGLTALGLAWATISAQSFKAATANPADSLRYE